MKYGFYSDDDLNTFPDLPFRCPSWTPMPDGKKNVVILGCSHTYGVGLEEHETWAHLVSQHNTAKLRYWNIAQPGASCDTIVRLLYSCEKVLYPNIIIVMWPEISRRQRLETHATNLMGTHESLRYENDKTDMNNFLKNVFFLEKFAEKNNCKTIHTFSDTYVEFRSDKQKQQVAVLEDVTLKGCWPRWDPTNGFNKEILKPSRARDGLHYGVDNHKQFASMFLARYKNKLK